MDGFRTDPPGFAVGISAEPRTLAIASLLLANQPAATAQRIARSVVEVTGSSEYMRSSNRSWVVLFRFISSRANGHTRDGIFPRGLKFGQRAKPCFQALVTS